eukprot:scaffold175_cov150-Isochrysis_galbana.AAC.11
MAHQPKPTHMSTFGIRHSSRALYTLYTVRSCVHVHMCACVLSLRRQGVRRSNALRRPERRWPRGSGVERTGAAVSRQPPAAERSAAASSRPAGTQAQAPAPAPALARAAAMAGHTGRGVLSDCSCRRARELRSDAHL